VKNKKGDKKDETYELVSSKAENGMNSKDEKCYEDRYKDLNGMGAR
jgi:hypothetical protein